VPAFFDWTPDDDPATILRPQSDADWDAVHNRYSSHATSHPLRRIIELVRGQAVVAILLEHRYIDADYRSEHSAFYSTTFRRYPSVCDRLHFFTADVSDDLSNLASLQSAYLGYAVMRPLDASPVGRTMLQPPQELAATGTVCTTSETVHVFGARFTARGMPFISQDAQYLRCAHAAQWMVLRHSTLRYGTPRWLTRDIQAAATGGVIIGRQVPSEGLTVHQMLGSLGTLGLSTGQLTLPKSRLESRNAGTLSLPATLCRHINSQMPPIVVSDQHAWVVVGYVVEGFDPALPNSVDSQHDRIVLYRHDDALGPYIRVPDPWNEPLVAHSPWNVVLTPLQRKCYLSGERAELIGRFWLGPMIGGIAAGAGTTNVTYRTYAIPSWEYKGELARIRPEAVGNLYRLVHMPRFIWVVEALDRDKLMAGIPDVVLGEVLIDSTANHVGEPDNDHPLLALHAAGFAASRSPDHETLTSVREQAAFRMYRSGCPAASG
jgi:hypothetical protein